MSDEDRKLLEAVRNWRPPKELHPIAVVAYRMYDENENAFTPKAIADLDRVLDEYGEDMENLAMAMEGLIRCMVYVGENLGDKDNAEELAKLLRKYAERFEPFWRRVAEAMENEGHDLKSSFQQLLGDGEEKKAPVYGEKAPMGSVQLKDIAPPPRPPPWAPKKK